MMKRTSLIIVGLACATAPAQVNSGITAKPGAGSPATVTGALERVVTGVPFSAESVTEFFQTATDGSHVKQATTAVVARDSNGRTRYSQTLLPLLPGGPRVFTTIRDPVAGVRYWIDSNEKAVQRELIRTPAPGERPRTGEGRDSGTSQSADTGRSTQPFSAQEAAAKVARQSVARALSARGGAALGRNTHPDTKALGDQTIEGVVATGVRVSAVVPAGEIGNEKPLTFTSEAWYSHELSIIVMSKVSDPVL
jgi:hypothetical protein